MYCIDGEDVSLEMLTAHDARTVLRALRAQAADIYSDHLAGML
ncbi:hypothetical protein [Mycobacterium avium]